MNKKVINTINTEASILPLNELREGEAGEIQSYQSNGGVTFRLKELGLVRGTRVLVERFAPFGDPIELLVRDYNLSIRKKDAAAIIVKRA